MVLGFEAAPDESPFAKPENTACFHLVPTGCAIYHDRPPVCRRFECAWLSAPNLPDELRPDRSGVLFSVNDNPLSDGYAVFAYEMRPGALEAELPQWLIGELCQEQTILLVRPGEDPEVLTPDPKLQRRLDQGK